MSIELRKILVPTDFSECARVALAQALDLARQHGAEVHFLHVMMAYEEDPYSLIYQVTDRHAILQQQQELCQRSMQDILEAENTDGLEIVEHRLRAFSVAPKILECATEMEADLIVIGAHGRRGIRRLLLGSIAEEVVRTARCPVLTVREGAQDLRMPPRKIVVPVDLSERGRSALEIARKLAATNTRIDLVHVVEDPIVPLAYQPAHEQAERYGFPQIAPRVEEAIAELAKNSAGPRVVSQIEVLEGRPAEAIVDYAESTGADLIVLTSHGFTGLDRLLLGSVCEEVVRLAGSPVLVLKDGVTFDD